MYVEEYTACGWVSKRFVIHLPTIRKETSLTMHGRRTKWPAPLKMYISINGTLVHQADLQEGAFTVQTKLQPVKNGKLEIFASSVFVPRDEDMDQDIRRLSLVLDDLVIPDLPDLMEPYNHLVDYHLRKPIWITDEEVWDRLCLVLPDSYKIPDKEMLQLLNNSQWWNRTPPLSSSISGNVYDKFSGEPLSKGKVLVFSTSGTCAKEISIDEKGFYQCTGVPVGEYQVVGKSEQYGEQVIQIIVDGFCKTIHIPMLPMNEA